MFHQPVRTAFTRTDLLAAIVICCLILSYSVTMVGCGGQNEELKKERAHARRMLSGTQIRGLQQGMVLYAQGNKNLYPGLDAKGNNVDSTVGTTAPYKAAALSTQTPTAAIYAILLSGNYVSPEYAISPLEPEKTKELAKPGDTAITTANYSYAMLAVADPAADKGRRTEWSDTQNSQAPVVADRSKAIDASLVTTSLHVESKTADSADWQGGVAWNDNHVTFETTGKLKVNMLKIGKTYDADGADMDDLFSGAAAGKFDATTNVLFAY